MQLFSSSFSLRKSKHVLKHVYRLFLRKRKVLSTSVSDQFKRGLTALQKEIEGKNRDAASALSHQLLALEKIYLKKSAFERVRDLVVGLGFALCVAILIRQVWFEFYEIPTGSMRPTLKEQDLLVVSKTAFGVNVPLTTRHLYFDPSLVKRGGIFIFTGAEMNIRDVNTLYFYLFPGKKQYVKRLMGKPGDTLFFYGGKIYGVDSEGKEISSELQDPALSQIEHIPFISFEGNVDCSPSQIPGVFSPVILYQMNEPVARLTATGPQTCSGEMLCPSTSEIGCKPVKDFSDLWGFKNFGTASLLSKEEVKRYTNHPLAELPEAPLYLEIKHHPTLRSLKIGRDEWGRIRPLLSYSSSLLPLTEAHLRELFSHMYTARFVVKEGRMARLGVRISSENSFLPRLPGVPDGTYEFYHGKAYEIKWQGVSFELPKAHPLYQFDLERVKLLYNVGMEVDMRAAPHSREQRRDPARYAYFRDGSLYSLGSPILQKEDPTLINFLEHEEKKKEMLATYEPFKDLGPPLTSEGKLDLDLIKAQGLQIPPNMYLALGDNHAMSSDSRDFGFVPQGNIRGAPCLIFWPPGPRWGYPNQPHYPFFNLPRSLVWVTAAAVFAAASLYHRKKHKALKF